MDAQSINTVAVVGRRTPGTTRSTETARTKTAERAGAPVIMIALEAQSLAAIPDDMDAGFGDNLNYCYNRI